MNGSSIDRVALVEQFLDQLGRSIPPSVFQLLSPSKHQHQNQSEEHLLALLGLRLTFVLDSSSVQRVLRVSLRHGKSGVLEGMKAGFIHPVAPLLLDKEIREHAPEIARDCGVPVGVVLDYYSREIRPLVEFKGVHVEEVARLRREIADPDDADFMALFLQVESLGIVTEDKAFAQTPGVKTFTVSEIGKIHLAYRKQAVAIVCGIPVAVLAVKAFGAILAGIAALCAQSKRNPRLVLGIAGSLLILAIMFPEQRKRFVKQLRAVGSDLGDLWNHLQPWAFAYAEAFARRAQEASLVGQQLTTSSTTARTGPSSTAGVRVVPGSLAS